MTILLKTNLMTDMPNLFSYTNFRTFLKDYYDFKKRANARFSYRLFARMAKFASPNFLKLVILGQRNLSPKGILQVSKALGLNERETQFFETLVCFNQETNHEEKKKYYERLGYFNEFNQIKHIDKQSFRYLSHWYNVAIREMALLTDFREDPAWIARKLKNLITEQTAASALKLLENLGLLKKDVYRRLRPTARNLSTDAEIMDLSVSDYHHQMIDLAADAIDNTPAQLRDISSVTVALDQKTFLEAKKRIQEFRKELNVLLSACKKPDAVYQVNFQIFNLTQTPWKK